jgi:protein involved in polysaccharide export with SLBB domain
VTVTGEVRRPASYEVEGNISVAEMIATAGGFTTEADTSHAWLARIDDSRRRVMLDVDFDARRGGCLSCGSSAGIYIQQKIGRPGDSRFNT